MGQVKAKPLYGPSTDIEDDFYVWCYEQADLLRQRRFGELDLPNLIEELESMGRSDKKALTSAYRVLLQQLLKWEFQPARRGSSWETTIGTQRREIEAIEEQSPSLAAKADDIMLIAYARARVDAAREMKVPASQLSEACPYSLEQVKSLDWLPE